MVSLQVKYPVSELNYAVSKQPLVQCVMGKTNQYGSNAHPGRIIPLEDYGEPTEACPRCGADDFPPLQEVPNLYYRPRPMKIMNPQPLEAATAVGGTYKRRPVYTLYLESPVADSYKLILPLPQAMTLNPILNEPQISSIGKSRNTCPTMTLKSLNGLMIRHLVNLTAKMAQLLPKAENILVGRKFLHILPSHYPILTSMNIKAQTPKLISFVIGIRRIKPFQLSLNPLRPIM